MPAKPSPQFVSVAVKKGQSFPIEWSSGHPGRNIYFTIVKAADEGRLKDFTEDMLDDYIKQAGSGKNLIKGNSHKHRKVQVRWKPDASDNDAVKQRAKKKRDTDPFSITPNERNYFDGEIKSSDSDFISRSNDPEKWRCDYLNSCKKPYQTKQYRYKKNNVDALVFNNDGKYPNIVGVGRYLLEPLGRGMDHDLANVVFPNSAATGDYIIQFRYQGYRDCLDVKVFPKSETVPQLTSKTQAIKIDHCEFPKGRISNQKTSQLGKCELIKPGQNGKTALKRLVEDCENEKACDGVNVIPMVVSPAVKFKAPPNLPSNCNFQALKNSAGSSATASFIAYRVKAKRAQPPLYLNHRIAPQDAEDQTFFSTCYLKTTTTQLGGSGGETAVTTRNIFNLKCISCEDAVRNAKLGRFEIAKWDITNECKICNGGSVIINPGNGNVDNNGNGNPGDNNGNGNPGDNGNGNSGDNGNAVDCKIKWGDWGKCKNGKKKKKG